MQFVISVADINTTKMILMVHVDDGQTNLWNGLELACKIKQNKDFYCSTR